MPFSRVAFHTLGCKLNQLETESLAQAFSIEGFRIVDWEATADLYIVNTCTVTSKAEQKARRLIRKALRERPAAAVIATGCYTQLDPADLTALAAEVGAELGLSSDRLVLVSGNAKAALLDLPAFLAQAGCTAPDLVAALKAWSAGGGASTANGAAESADRFRFDANDFAFHSRSSLKIQDGCDNRCSYCRVRLARGKSVSLAADETLRRLRHLEERGYAEVVLTGVNIFRYRDPAAELDLTGLLRRLLDGTERIALRLSSVEPQGVSGAFLELVAHPRIRPHFHLSIQSASDAVLTRMRRSYTADQAASVVNRLRSAKDDPFLACDLIAGFPGESDDDFQRSYDFCENAEFAAIHAFPYSPRPGTEAYAFRPSVPERIAVERVDRLAALALAGRRSYVDRWRGRTIEAIAERKAGTAEGTAALTANYLNILIANRNILPGTAFECRLPALDDPSLPPDFYSTFDAEAEAVNGDT